MAHTRYQMDTDPDNRLHTRPSAKTRRSRSTTLIFIFSLGTRLDQLRIGVYVKTKMNETTILYEKVGGI